MTDIQTLTAVDELSAAEFYTELTRRNRGIIGEDEQRALREATVLVAGCGSVGGAAVQPLARLGVQRFLLADPGVFELNNLNRQQAGVRDIDRNKAEVAAEHVLAVNPHAQVKVFPDGVTAEHVDELTGSCQAIVDGVDVTTDSGWRAKFLLHQKAIQRRLPLVTGWDMAGVQYLQCYDYRELDRPFNGIITAQEVERLSVWELILKAIPFERIPPEMLAEVSPNLQNPDYSVPQVVYAALLFGAITSHVIVKLLTGERVPPEVHFDLHQAVRLPDAQRTSTDSWPRETEAMRQALRRLATALGH